MRPTGLELLRGVRTLLAEEILPGAAPPHLRAQLMLAVGMLDAAAREMEDAPAAYADERARMVGLAAEAVPVVRRLAPDHPLLLDLETLAAAPVAPPDGRMSAMAVESARLLDHLDRLCAFCDAHCAAGNGADLDTLARRVDDELRALAARRLTWTGGTVA